MAQVIDYIVPLVLLGVSLAALGKRENGYDLMLQGAARGCGSSSPWLRR